tara:strand:- start:4 stop:237 length:234 start_codon:yes stop_codon:yes gene_type:complete
MPCLVSEGTIHSTIPTMPHLLVHWQKIIFISLSGLQKEPMMYPQNLLIYLFIYAFFIEGSKLQMTSTAFQAGPHFQT